MADIDSQITEFPIPVRSTTDISATEAMNAIKGVASTELSESDIKDAVLAADKMESTASASVNFFGTEFVGDWSTLTGPLNTPARVYHSNKSWKLLNNLADVTTSEPGVSADWEELPNQDQIETNKDNIQTNTTNIQTNSNDIDALETDVDNLETDVTNIQNQLADKLVTGTATFTNTNNNIELTGVGLISGLEIGDVIQVSGSNSNNKEFTVESITNDDNIIVNAAHAGGTSSKSLVNEAGTVNVTVKLLCKWFQAPIGLGQGWVNVTSSRSGGQPYVNNTKRTYKISAIVTIPSGTGAQANITIDTILICSEYGRNNDFEHRHTLVSNIPDGSTVQIDAAGSTINNWNELR